MNYQAMKSVLDIIIKSYKCPFCNSQIWEDLVEIVWAAGTSINMSMWCAKCKKSVVLQANLMPVNKMINIDKDKLEALKKKFMEVANLKIKVNSMKKTINWVKEIENFINDEDIVNFSKKLKQKNVNISDIFWE